MATVGVPGAGAGIPIAGDREWRGGVGAAAGDNKLNVDAEDGAAVGIPAAGAKDSEVPASIENVVAGGQRNARHASIAGVAAAFAEAAREGGDEGDGQSKKKTGTATMHEPSSRPIFQARA